MIYTKRTLPKKKAKSKRRIYNGISRLLASRPNNPCEGKLTPESLRLAAEYHGLGKLDMLRGKLHCVECGQFVNAWPAKDGDFLALPSPHERYKEPRKPAPAKFNGRKS
jgi:hypothetical protein